MKVCKVKFIFYVLSFIAFTCEAKPPRSIVPLLKRVLTHGGAACHFLADGYRNAFLGRNMVNLVSFLYPAPHHFEQFNESPHQQFHEEMHNRIASHEASKATGEKKVVDRESEMMPDVGTSFLNEFKEEFSQDTQDLNKKMARRTRWDFTEGHCLDVAGVTCVPLVGIHVRSFANDNPIRYICPIEYAWPCKTIVDYRREACLLKTWALYSDFYLVSIPRDAYVRVKIGLNAPQTFPALNRSVYSGKIGRQQNLNNKDSNDISYLLNHSLISEDDIERFQRILQQVTITDPDILTEWFYGGRAQVYIGTAEKYHVVHLGSIYSDEEKASFRRMMDNGNNYHYLVEQEYDQRPIDFTGKLYSSKIITSDEKDELRKWEEKGMLH